MEQTTITTWCVLPCAPSAPQAGGAGGCGSGSASRAAPRTSRSRIGERTRRQFGVTRKTTSHLGTGWQDQRARVGRWHKRLTSLSYGIPTDVHKAEALDDVYAFFMNCYHLRDWIIQSEFRDRADVDAFIDGNLALSLCRDICNGMKHFRIDPARASSAPNWSTATTFQSVVSGSTPAVPVPAPGREPIPDERWDITTGTDNIDMFALAEP